MKIIHNLTSDHDDNDFNSLKKGIKGHWAAHGGVYICRKFENPCSNEVEGEVEKILIGG